LSVIEAASGIVDIANATMVQAMRLVSVQRGYDPRDFVLVAFGGAGPVHATGLADDLGIPTVVVPPAPGVASALGMLASNVRRDYRVTYMIHLADTCPDAIETIFRELEERAALALADEGFTPQRISLQRSLDLRYVGQSWKLAVTLPDGVLTPEGLNRLKRQFDRQHEEQYGYHVPEEAVEVVSLALSAQGLVPPLALQEVPRGEDSSAGAQMTMRPVFFRESGGYVETPIYDRYRLLHGNIIEGPAIVVEMDATTVIEPGYRGEVGPFGILSIQPAGGGMRSSANAKPLSI
jgi:N-methylhydantoinase A